jgi:hypothetical protein
MAPPIAALDVDARRRLGLLDGRGHRMVLASTGKRNESDHYLDLRDGRAVLVGDSTFDREAATRAEVPP